VADEFPSLLLEVKVSPLSKVSLETVQAGADAGILEHREELSDYVCKPIYTERWGLVRHPEVKHSDLRKYKWGTVATHENPVDTWLVRRQKMSPPAYRIYWQDLTAVGVWVSETPGAATVLPWHAVAWMAKRGKVVFEPLGSDSTTTLYLAYQKNSPHKRFLKALTQLSEKTLPLPPATDL
jgi:DNA-binding transcriptional LysR family regulator